VSIDDIMSTLPLRSTYTTDMLLSLLFAGRMPSVSDKLDIFLIKFVSQNSARYCATSRIPDQIQRREDGHPRDSFEEKYECHRWLGRRQL